MSARDTFDREPRTTALDAGTTSEPRRACRPAVGVGAMLSPDCICDFDDDCGGSGVQKCVGCGGDFCVCAACQGNGEQDCDGCEMCDERDHEAGGAP